MSWQVDGHYYHNYAEYQRALQARDQRQARAEIDTLRQEAERHARRASKAEQGLREARGDLASQRRLQEALDASVADLRSTQQRMAEAQRSLVTEVERQFQAVRDDLTATDHQVSQIGCALDATRDDLALLEQEHRRHVEAVRGEFARADAELASGLAEAERRRAAGEAALRREIGEVDAKVEADRADRVERARGEAGRAEAMAEFVDERLPSLRAAQDSLELRGEVAQIEEDLAQSRARLARGDSAVGLALASGAYARLRTAEMLALARRAELDHAVERMTDTIGAIRSQLGRAEADGENPIRTYFGREAAGVDAALAAIEARIPAIYARYRQTFGQRPVEESDLDELREVARGLVVAAPMAKGYFEERKAKLARIIADLRAEFGRQSSVTARLADEDDPKSTLQLDCDFGGRTVRILIPIEPDAAFQADVAGHQTDADCAADGLRVARVLAREARITEVQADPRARSAPRIEAEPRPSPWAGLSDRIERIRGRS